MRFLAAKNIVIERPDSIEKKQKVTRKYMKEIDSFKPKIIGIKGIIKYDWKRLLNDLVFKEKSTIKGIKLIETKFKRQKECLSERIIARMKILLFNKVSSECYGLYDLYLD